MVVAKWVGTLSTTEPFNHVGLMKVRYANKESEVFEYNFAENNLPKDLTGLAVNFCVTPKGKLSVERPAVIIDAKKGKVRFVMTKDCMQQYGENTAYFNFYRGTEYLGSTQDFNYTVTWSIDGNPYDGTEYIQRLEDYLDYFAFIEATLGEDAAFSLAKKVTDLETNKVDLVVFNDVTSDIYEVKVDRSYFDLIIASLGTGGPREVFYSIQALKNRYPNGETGTFLVFDTSFPNSAHAFIWNGTAWVDLGPYQATEVADGSLGVKKIKFNPYSQLQYNQTNFSNEYLGYDDNGCLYLTKDVPVLVNKNHQNIMLANDRVQPINFVTIDFIQMETTDSARLFFGYYDENLIVANYEGLGTNNVSFYRIENGDVVTQIFPEFKLFLYEDQFKKGFSLTFGVTGNYIVFYANGKLVWKIESKSYANGPFNLTGTAYRGTMSANSHVRNIRYNVAPKPYMHVSVDDVNWILKEVTVNKANYTSLFDSPFFGFIKSLHDKYGAVFSLYLFYEGADGWTINNMTSQYKQELIKHASWLKFGFHAQKEASDYNVLTKEELFADYSQIMSEIKRFSNTMNIDSIPRFHAFGAKRESQFYLQEKHALFDGMLTADDSRELNGGLSGDALHLVRWTDYFYDQVTGLFYVKSEQRLDQHIKNTAEATIDSVRNMLNNAKDDVNHSNIYTIFLHEVNIKNDNSTGKVPLEEACKWAHEQRVRFDFPQNNKPLI